MDFPYFEFPWLGNRWLIAIVATLHVLVNHSAAIGGSLLVVLMERRGLKELNADWDAAAYRLAFIFFLLTTTVGALSGVGIWFTVMVSAPQALSALLYIFFWAWFIEWGVFIAEVGMVLAYFLSWNRFKSRDRHLALGWAYVLTSFLTLAIISGILGAMLTPGSWLEERGFWGAFFNPTYLPQLILRSGLALALAAVLGLLLQGRVASENIRGDFQRLCGQFLLMALPLMAVGGAGYLWVLPERVKALLPTALMTQRYADWASLGLGFQVAACVAVGILGLMTLRRDRLVPRLGVTLVAVLLLGWVGHFERVREFVRKPFLIPGYMYANGIRVSEVPRLNRDGLLGGARWAEVSGVVPGKEIAAGRALFRLQCAACHTLSGPNALGDKFAGRDVDAVVGFLSVQHQVYPFMPPFVGTEVEKRALAEFLAGPPSEEVARNPGVKP
ncbi:MAG: c-type cytochrome [Candidatus Sericytochromatia bacterium]|nr:c-type cytochrome [Candidatus Sericytochromatia bacterium]